MKVALVSPMMSKTRIGNVPIPQGILSLSAVVKSKGCQCDILDYNKHDYGVDALKKYDLVGLSVLTSQLPHATALANEIRKNTKIVWGGIHCLFDPLSILRSYPETFVISGEGEPSLSSLIDHFTGAQPDIDKIEGLSYADATGYRVKPPAFLENINALPDINYYDLPYLERYLDMYSFYFNKTMRTLEVVTGRGCCWDCSFCINSIFRKHKASHRVKTFEKIKREITRPVKDLKIEVLLPADDDFFANKKLVAEWSSYTREKGLLWRGNCRYNYLGRPGLMSADLKRLAGSGLFEVGMSIEAGDEDIRNRILNKVLKDADIVKGVSVMKESGTAIVVNTSFISYFPGDTDDNRIKMIKLMDFLSRSLNIVFSGPQVYRVYPGSKLTTGRDERMTAELSYYLDNLTVDGWLKSAEEQNEDDLLFYSIVLSHYFNRKFHVIERVGNNEVRRTSIKKEGVLIRIILSLLMSTIALRLRTDYWGCLVEPRYIGKLYRVVRNIGRAFQRRPLGIEGHL